MIRLNCQSLPLPCLRLRALRTGATTTSLPPLPPGQGGVDPLSPPVEGNMFPGMVPCLVSHGEWPVWRREAVLILGQRCSTKYVCISFLKWEATKRTPRWGTVLWKPLHPIKGCQSFLQGKWELIREAPPVLFAHLVLEPVKNLKPNTRKGF